MQRLVEDWQKTAMPLIMQAAGPKHVIRAGLVTFLEQVKQYPEAYRSAMQAGSGVDDEILVLREDLRDRALHMIAIFFRLDPVPPMFRAGCRAWLSFVESATLDWLDDPSLDRDELVEMLRAALRTLLPLKDGPLTGELEPAPIESPDR